MKMKMIRERNECNASMNGQRYGRITRIWVITMLLLLAANIFTANAEQINEHQDSRTDVRTDDDLQVDFFGSGARTDENAKRPLKSSIYEKELARCPHTSSKIMLSLILRKNNWDSITYNKCDRAKTKLSEIFSVPKDLMLTANIAPKDLTVMIANAIQKANDLPQNRKYLGKLEFVIGCGDYFTTGHIIAKRIAHQMNIISDKTGLNFGSWIIWRKSANFRKPRISRSKRDTDNKEGSGDDDYYYDEDESEDPAEEKAANESSRLDDESSDIVAVRSTTTKYGSETIAETTDMGDYNDADYNDDLEDNDDLDNEDSINTKVTVSSPTTTTQKTAVETTTVPVIMTTIASTEPSSTSTTTTTTTTTSSSTTTTSTTTTTAAATASATTTTTPEPITTTMEPEGNLNNPPIIKVRLAKLAVTAGKPFNHTVPMETFYDSEDGTNLRLELLDKHGKPLDARSWIQFNAQTRSIYGLPLEDAVSKWQYKLKATDGSNESVIESLDISVQQHKSHRSVNHEIVIGVSLLSDFVNNIDWQMKLIRGIVDILGDASSVILVRDIRYGFQDSGSATFIFTNESLPKDICPENQLNEIIERLTVTALDGALAPELSIKSIKGKTIGTCSKPDTVKPTAPKPTPHLMKNYPPMPRNPVDRVNATVNQLLVFKVPSDTFYDPEDEIDLKLSLLTNERLELDPNGWLQFDAKNKEFYGIPKPEDAGQREYVLVAEDREGLQATDALVVVASPIPTRPYGVVFELELGIPYDDFNNAAAQRRFVERIALIFNDPTTSNILFRAIRKLHQTGSTNVQFYNTTLYRPHNVCPTDDIEALKKVLVHHDGSLRQRVKDIVGPEFDLDRISFAPNGPCLEMEKNINHASIPIKPDDSDLMHFKDEYLLTVIVPSVIIAAMLLLTCVIACILHRRRMTGKMELGKYGDEEERRSFRSKGIPVIFQDELDEKPEIGNKSPIILKDEKPPLLPPSYNSTNPDDHDDMEDYIPPPAVVMSGRDSRGKSPVTPSYRKPPPYVSP